MSNLIRTAQLADLPQLKAIYNHAVAHSTATFDLYPRDDADRLAWFQAHQGKYALLVCETDGVIAGYASLSRYRERPAFDGAAEVSIYLHPDFRGQHIGSQLMQKILAFAAQQPDIDTVVSLITSENTVQYPFARKIRLYTVRRHSSVRKEIRQVSGSQHLSNFILIYVSCTNFCAFFQIMLHRQHKEIPV